MSRTDSALSTCLLIPWITPSILILTGAFEVKNRSDALRSAISLSSGLMLKRPSCASASTAAGGPPSGLVDFAVVGLIDDPQRARGLGLQPVLALALELDAQPQLVLGVGVPEALLIGDDARLVEVEQRLVEGLHAEAVRAPHHFLDLRDLAAEDQVRDERRADHDLHGGDAALGLLARYQALRDHRADVQRQVHQELLALLLGEEVDDAVERLVGAVRV